MAVTQILRINLTNLKACRIYSKKTPFFLHPLKFYLFVVNSALKILQ